MSQIINKNITSQTVNKAKGMLRCKMSLREIAKSCDISPYTVFRIKHGDYDEPHCFNKRSHKFIPDEVRRQIKHLAGLFSYGVVARKYEISRASVCRIVNGKDKNRIATSKYKCPITGMTI